MSLFSFWALAFRTRSVGVMAVGAITV
jgi:hypothetical protein